MDSHSSSWFRRLLRFLQLGIWFGIVTGLLEGIGLLVFKHINWQNWGRMVHVSGEILWISPLVDLFIFTSVALACFFLSEIWTRIRALRSMVFLFVGLAVYDWVTLTNRLWHISCLLIAVGAAVAFDRWFADHEDAAMHFWKRTFPWIPALLLLVFLVVEGGTRLREHYAVANLPPAAPGWPNVIILVIDDLRADHVTAYGYSRPTTPYLDRMAAQGALFENVIVTAPWSLPSHASIVTGRYPYEHGASDIRASWSSLTEPPFSGYTSIGQALQRHGYRAGAFSGNRVYFTHDSGFGSGFNHFEDYFHSPKDSILRTVYGQELLRLTGTRFRYLLRKPAGAVNRELLSWIDRDRQRPFFAFLNYFDTHDRETGTDGSSKPSWPRTTQIDEYDIALRYDDDLLARLMAQLERRSLSKNTLVMVLGDHGEALGQHDLLGHSRALYWELLHVPLVIWYPGHVPAALRVNRPVSTGAIPATIMDLVTNGSDKEFPGPPLDRLWNSPADAANWPFPLSEIARNPYPEETEKLADQIEPTSTTGSMTSLVTPQYHLILHENLGPQLYDWVHDRGEQTNLVGTAEGRAAAMKLTATVRDMMGPAAPAEFNQQIAAASPLHDGAFDIDAARRSTTSRQPLSDYYRLQVMPGSRVTIKVTRPSRSATKLDPVLAIQDAQGVVLNTCRNPGDDHLGPPGIPDATPDMFDDLCLDDDPRSGVADPELEFAVPRGANGPFDVYVHIMNWKPESGGEYRLTLSSTSVPGEGVAGAGAGH